MNAERLGLPRASAAAANIMRTIETSVGHPFSPEVYKHLHTQLRGMLKDLYLRDDKTIGNTNIESIIRGNAAHKEKQLQNRKETTNEHDSTELGTQQPAI